MLLTKAKSPSAWNTIVQYVNLESWFTKYLDSNHSVINYIFSFTKT